MRSPYRTGRFWGWKHLRSVGQHLQAQVGWWDHLDLETPEVLDRC